MSAEQSWGVLFDMDGTICVSDELHFKVFQEYLRPHLGFDIDNHFYGEKIHGKHNSELFRAIFPDRFKHSDETLVTMSIEKESRFCQLVRQVGMPKIPGLDEFISWIKANGGRVGCVTNAPRTNAEVILGALGVMDDFEILIIGEECTRAKPAPDPYLEGAKVLGLDITRCIVFEDSPSGVKSAVDAGVCGVIGVKTGLDEAKFLSIGAAWAVSDFEGEELRHKILDMLDIRKKEGKLAVALTNHSSSNGA